MVKNMGTVAFRQNIKSSIAIDFLPYRLLNALYHMMKSGENYNAELNGKSRGANGFGMADRKQPEGLLVHHIYNFHKNGNDKRMTDKQRFL